MSYVGTQGHHLLSSESANPGNPALCLSLAAENCGPTGENNIYIRPDGTYVLGTRTPFSGVVLPAGTQVSGGTLLPDGNIGIIPFGNDSYFITGSYSSYNSAQVNWRHTSNRSQLLVGYTFSKSLDNSSGYGEQYNPINPRLSRGLSAFDSTHNFVASYAYTLPIDKLAGPKKLTNGWQIRRHHSLRYRPAGDDRRKRRPFPSGHSYRGANHSRRGHPQCHRAAQYYEPTQNRGAILQPGGVSAPTPSDRKAMPIADFSTDPESTTGISR